MKYRYDYDDCSLEPNPPNYIDGFHPDDWKEMAISLIENDVNLIPDSILGRFAESIILRSDKNVYGPIYPRCIRAIITKNEDRLPLKRLIGQFSLALIRKNSSCIISDDRLKIIADAIITGNKFCLDNLEKEY